MATTCVLCHIRDGARVLLQLKADGRFGAGRWNGPGGKITDGELPEEAMVREVREETGLTVCDLRDHGTLTFYFGEATEPDFIVHVFSTERFEGDIQANEEGRLEWFPEDTLPYDRMWPDDRLWVPQLLAGRRFQGTFRLSDDMSQITWHELQVEP
jgi:mutator protein MutT